MSAPLPRLRLDLDFMPSPVQERPGLLMRDPFGYSDVTLIIPPPLVPCLSLFDGEQTELDLRAALVQITGQFDVGDLQKNLTETLSEAGFLHDERHAQMKHECRRLFADSADREPAHAGSGYPEEPDELRAVFDEYMGEEEKPPADAGAAIRAIAAPHVSPFGGWQSYQAAYRSLQQSLQGGAAGTTFVVLGTSHYGEPNRFGLTRKRFITPYGAARCAQPLVDELAAKAPEAVLMEDYCHAREHSIEFQVVFLQHLFGPDVEILPILCGSFAESIYRGGRPEEDPAVERFFDALGNAYAREGKRLVTVLGVDMAHMGRRYQDEEDAIAGEGLMVEVARRDEARIASINAADAAGYWEQVQQNRDDLKWCGSAPFYTFLRTQPGLRGETLRYEQWNIDDASVVSFAGMAFRAS